MKHELPPLDSLKAFEASARLLSFTHAANELCISKGAISYHIKKLEAHLGQALFKRTTRQILLTDAGQILWQHTQTWFNQLNHQLQQLQKNNNHNLVIAVTTYTAVRWLSPKLAAYRHQHPQQSITLRHSFTTHYPNSLDTQTTHTDISIRWQPYLGKSDYFFAAPLFPVASPKLIKQLNLTQSLNLDKPPWQQINLLVEQRKEDLWQAWNDNRPVTNPQQVIDDANVRVQAAIDGQGLILADQLMQAELESGVLVKLSKQQLEDVGYGITAHSPQGNNLLQWLLEDET